MSAETELYTVLSTHAPLTALVSTRIYPDAFPENCARPAVAFSRTATNLIRSISGTVFGRESTLQIYCWGDTRGSADAVADAVEAAVIAAGYEYANRTAGYDEEVGAFAATIEVVILTG